MNKYLLLPMLFATASIMAQQKISGHISDAASGKPLAGVTVVIQDSPAAALTDKEGYFTLAAPVSAIRLSIRKEGYQAITVDVQLPLKKPLHIVLAEKINDLEELTLTTGYQKLPKERATGSFSVVGSRDLDRQVSVNILDRLSAAANGIITDRGTANGQEQVMVRGLSTIRGPKSPLIVVDNFPYEGDIKNINPNTVESITILKDAAAASIWGARAANGVVVITTKKASTAQPLRVTLNTSLTLSGKPDLGYLPVISTSDFIDVEQVLFSKGFYNTDISSSQHTVLSPVVDLLNKAKNGQVTQAYAQQQIDALRAVDVRDDYRKYMYLPLENRQYALNLSAGSKTMAWSSSLGYDDNSGNLGEKYQRLSLRFQNTWKPLQGLTVDTGVWMIRSSTESGRSSYGSIVVKSNGLPYMQLADKNGNPLAVYRTYNQDYKTGLGNGRLLDWNYYPLTDWQHNQNTNTTTEWLLNAGLTYRIIKGLDAELRYQWQKRDGISEMLYDEQSYYTRNYTNLFTVLNTDGTAKYNVPRGSIFNRADSDTSVQNIRGQLNYNRNFGNHTIAAIAGAEARDITTSSLSNRYYGYNQNQLTFVDVDYNATLPRLIGGSSTLDGNSYFSKTTNRFVSLYTNAAYTFMNRYTISGSARRDASNLFGLKTNDLWNPFWSAGLAWNLSSEPFYNIAWLPALKLRASYGFNGNINPAMVAVSTIGFQPTVSPYTGTPMATITNYYNPDLKWETTNVLNLGIDFTSRNGRLAGSVEWYRKKGDHLFGENPIDYTTGITSMVYNVAAMQGEGVDIALHSRNTVGVFKWNTTFNMTHYRDKVTTYYLSSRYGNQFVQASVPISGVEGKPVYSVFGYQWAGLDPQTGDPMGYLNGAVSKDYARITGTGTTVDDLQYFGSAVPVTYGNFTNSFSYHNFTLDVGMTYKLGYWFRRSSINYTALYRDWLGHSDYALRWQKPGDEAWTQVPSNLYVSNTGRDAFYAGSAALVEKGDHIRLQYINLSYDLSKKQWQGIPFTSMQIYTNLSNLGILWQASKSGRDPDYNIGNFMLTPPLTYTIGMRAQF